MNNCLDGDDEPVTVVQAGWYGAAVGAFIMWVLLIVCFSLFGCGVASAATHEESTELIAGRHIVLTIARTQPSPAPPEVNRHARRLLWNGVFAALQLVEMRVDCGQTARILLRGGPGSGENDPLVPRRIVTQLKRGQVGGCVALGTGLILGEFAALHRASPAFMGAVTVGEGLNIETNAGQENR